MANTKRPHPNLGAEFPPAPLGNIRFIHPQQIDGPFPLTVWSTPNQHDLLGVHYPQFSNYASTGSPQFSFPGDYGHTVVINQSPAHVTFSKRREGAFVSHHPFVAKYFPGYRNPPEVPSTHLYRPEIINSVRGPVYPFNHPIVYKSYPTSHVNGASVTQDVFSTENVSVDIPPDLDERRSSTSTVGGSIEPLTPRMTCAQSGVPADSMPLYSPSEPTDMAEAVAIALADPSIPRPYHADVKVGLPRRLALEQALQNAPNNCNVHIRGLPPMATDDYVLELTQRFGKIKDSRAKAMLNMSTGLCKGFGFVEYETAKEAKFCIRVLNEVGYEVGFAKESFSDKIKAAADARSTNLYITNIPCDYDEQDLEALFTGFTVVSSRIIRERGTGENKGVGFCSFLSRAICDQIIAKFHNTETRDQKKPEPNAPLQVKYCDSEKQKELKKSRYALSGQARTFIQYNQGRPSEGSISPTSRSSKVVSLQAFNLHAKPFYPNKVWRMGHSRGAREHTIGNPDGSEQSPSSDPSTLTSSTDAINLQPSGSSTSTPSQSKGQPSSGPTIVHSSSYRASHDQVW